MGNGRGQGRSQAPQTFEVVAARIQGKDLIIETNPPHPDVTNGFTDPSLALEEENRLTIDPNPPGGLILRSFGPNVQLLAGQTPDVNRNPYNFVPFAADQPWTEINNPGHAVWHNDLWSGTLEYTITALTPLFIPEGFPFAVSDREIGRHFFRMPNRAGEVRYAIPGASLKGVIRSAVEALSNSPCGEINTEAYERKIPYRRRVFRCGYMRKTANRGWEIFEVQPQNIIHFSTDDGWERQELEKGLPQYFECFSVGRRHFARPSRVPFRRAASFAYLQAERNLFAQPSDLDCYQYIYLPLGHSHAVDQGVVDTYVDNIGHPHYQHHWDDHWTPERYRNLRAANDFERLKQLDGKMVYCTRDEDGKIDSLGRNVNYLWPAVHPVKELIKNFIPSATPSLKGKLGLAERMFGFAGDHKKNVSHPYRGKVRFETAWGTTAADHKTEKQWVDALKWQPGHPGMKVELGPLTGPRTRAKARPLYLKGADGKSGSYDDDRCAWNGRKFYWHQQASPAGHLWNKHLKANLHANVLTQCPPPLFALEPKAEFRGRIHFDNLTQSELGCLLYALEGDGSYNHAFKLGKGKPRGMGSVRCRVTAIERVQATDYYTSLLEEPKRHIYKAAALTSEKKVQIDAFTKWRAPAGKSLHELEHIQEYDAMHTELGNDVSIRYYPINFNQYGWLPKANCNPADPPSAQRPNALAIATKAADLNV